MLRRAALFAVALSLIAVVAACRSGQTENSQGGVIVINAPAAGVVRRVLVNEGSLVSEGTPVVEIAVEQPAPATAPSPGESADARAARGVKNAEAAIDAARAEVVKHEAEVLRLTPLVAAGQASQSQLDAERSLYEQAQRRLQQAQDASRQAQSELLSARQPGAQANSAQTAPRMEMVFARATSAGTVAVISARVGDRVTSGQPLATLRTASPWSRGLMEPSAINIGPREIRKRRLMGIVALAVGVALAFALVVFEAPRLVRLIVFFPVWMAGLGLFQAREKTWIAMAARGTRNMDTGEETVAVEKELAQLRTTARRIHRRALITAIVVTLVALAFPTTWFL
jgi:biotin carboxyl carrier protein